MVTGIPRNPRALLQMLSISIPEILGEKIVGLYVYGSLLSGGYDDGVSDVDLLAITTEDLDDEVLERLRVMHTVIEKEHPQWSNRVEVAYLSADGMRSFKTTARQMLNISPGEPIHRIPAGKDWLMNWYLVRTGGVPLMGPLPERFIPEISKAEFVEAIGEYVRDADTWSNRMHDRKSQSYAILTMCRALHTLVTGEHHSKQESATWAQKRFPEWSDLIVTALKRRSEPDDAPRLPVHPDAPELLTVIWEQVVTRLQDRLL